MSTVLIVDDSPTVRVTLRGWLTAAGYTTREAANGLQALDALRASEEPLIVLLDYQMPEMDGLGVLERAQAEGLVPPRFAYVTISSMAANFPQALNALLRQLDIQILPKPFDRDTLLEVTRFVERRLDEAQTAG